jgi:hypothetical protein
MNLLQSWIFFQNPDRNFINLSHKLQEIRPKLIILNEKRKIIQQEISSLSKYTDACRICLNSCCRGNYNHFTMVDYLIRMFSDNPIREFEEVKQQITLFSILFTKFRPILKNPASKNTSSGSKCPNLTAKGCEFLPEDRPIRCIIYTCKTFRQTVSSDVFYKIGHLTKELSLISSKVIKLFS